MAEPVSGRVPDGTGLSSSTEPASRLGPSGFDPSRIERPDFVTRLRDFGDAVVDLPWVFARLHGGQQFNAYEASDNDEDGDPSEWLYLLCIGPITDHRFICSISGQHRARLVEAALKVATEALRDSDQSGEAGQTAKQAGPEGRERGPKASPNPMIALSEERGNG